MIRRYPVRAGLFLWVLLVVVFPCSGSEANLRLEARDVMAKAKFASLITIDQEGQPRARTVDPFDPDENFVVWIATRPVTRKVEQIRNNPRVTLYYWHADTASYVTLMGRARLVDDLATKQALRRERDSARFYPDFPDDYLLIEVTPFSLEALVPSFRGDPETWQPAVIEFAAEPAASADQ